MQACSMGAIPFHSNSREPRERIVSLTVRYVGTHRKQCAWVHYFTHASARFIERSFMQRRALIFHKLAALHNAELFLIKRTVS